MPISIQCPACKREYKVDDKLAGKKVKCKQCGEAITVASDMDLVEPDVFGLEDGPTESAPAPKGGGGGGGPSVVRCPSCRTPNSPAAIVCVGCGYNLKPAPAVEVESVALAEKAAQKKKRKFVRDPGSPTLNSIDGLITMIVWWGSIAALAVWVVYLARQMGGLSASSLIPLGLVIGLGALIVAPLMLIAIKLTANFAQFIPRNDTFNRILLALVLPFGVSLLAGWNASAIEPLMPVAVLAGVGLFVYLFRGEAKEWIATVAAGLVAGAVGWVLAGIIASVVGSAAGPLYTEMLPPGPWKKFAPEHWTPQAPTPPKKEVAVAPSAGTQTATMATSTGPAPLPPGINVVSGTRPRPNDTDAQVATVTQSPTPNTDTHPPTSQIPTPGQPTPIAPAGPSFITDVSLDDKNLQDVREVLAPPVPAPWLLVIKGSDTGSATAERWTVGAQASVMKGVQNFSELPKQPNSYALSPKGDALVSIVRFPKNQLQISNFDNKTVRTYPLDDPRGDPMLLGFLDTLHVCVRWGSMTRLQVWSTYNGAPTRTISPEVAGSFASEADLTFSPNGHLMCTLGRGPTGEQQLVIVNVDTGMVAKRITPTSGQFKLLGLAFTPDNSQVVMYAMISEAPSLLSFKVSNGDPIHSYLLGAIPVSPVARTTARPPGLLCLQNGLAWLVDGNDFYDPLTGKKIGSLNLPDLVNLSLAGSDSVAFVQTTAEGTKKATIARFDDAVIKDQIKAEQ